MEKNLVLKSSTSIRLFYPHGKLKL